LANLNNVIRILKELGQDKQAKDLLEFFVAQKSTEFWDSSQNFFQQGPYEPEVDAMISSQKAKVETPFVFDAALIEAAKTFQSDLIAKLADVPVDEYYRLIKAKNCDDLRKFVLSGLEFRRISNASPEMQEIVRRMEEALRRVASESDLNAVRVRKYGIDL
jgi:hypothetical protein